jgi:hypothetical protein
MDNEGYGMEATAADADAVAGVDPVTGVGRRGGSFLWVTALIVLPVLPVEETCPCGVLGVAQIRRIF